MKGLPAGTRTVEINGKAFHFAPVAPLDYVYRARNGILVRSCQPPVVSEWETNVFTYWYHSWRHWYRNIRKWNRGKWGANLFHAAQRSSFS